MGNSFIVNDVGGISGSLTQLVNGISYLVASSGITITSQSNGQIVLGSGVIDVQVFTSNGTWNKPSGIRFVDVTLVGGGAGGGGGYQHNANGLPGGPGGGSGGKSHVVFQASDLVASASVTVGLGGNGGAASAPGLTGSVGGSSQFGTYAWAGGGTPTITYDGLLPGDRSEGGFGDSFGGAGGDVIDTTGGLPATTDTNVYFGKLPGGGGAGGYKTTTYCPAGMGGSSAAFPGSGGVAGTSGGNGGNGTNAPTNIPMIGAGGGGGSSGAIAGNSGDGGLYGGGGGGGGSGPTAGQGGDGADGIVVIVSY